MKVEFTYNDPRLDMTLAGRGLVHIGEVIGEVMLITSTVLALLSTISWVRWLGVFLVLFLIDFLLHRSRGDVSVVELWKRERIELSHALSPTAARIIANAFEAARITGTDLSLELALLLLTKRKVRRSLSHANIDSREVFAKLKEFMKREEAYEPATRGMQKDRIKDILIAAFARAREDEHRFIEPLDMFYALSETGSILTRRLFTMFEII